MASLAVLFPIGWLSPPRGKDIHFPLSNLNLCATYVEIKISQVIKNSF
jgi:hypothetical protein